MNAPPLEDAARPPPASPLPGARPALVLLLLINLFNYIDRQVLAAVVPQIKATFFGAGSVAPAGVLGALLGWCQGHLGFKPENALIGVLSTAFMVFYMLGAPVFAKLAEKQSRWLLVGVGVTLWSLASGASGLATSFMMLLATRCFVGVGEAAYGPVAPAMISDLYPIRIRGRVLAWFYLAIPVGSALGYVIGDAVARSNLGPWLHELAGTRTESWRWAFYLVVIPGLLLGLRSFFMREVPPGGTELARGEARRSFGWRDYAVLLRTPSYVLCTLGMTAMTFALGGIAFWMPYFLSQKPGAPAAATAIFGAISVVAGLAGTLLGGLAGDRLRARYAGSYFLVSGIAILLGFPFLLLALTADFGLIWLWLFLACFCLFFNTGPTNTVLANVTHPRLRAAGYACNILVIHALGDVLSPIVIGIISDRYSMLAAFRVVGGMFLVAGVFWLAGMRFLARDTEVATRGLPE